MSAAQAQVILFDLGGVLVDFAGFERVAALLPEPVGEDEIRERWLRSSAICDFELGRIGPGEFAERFLGEWELGLSPDEFLQEFVSWSRGLYPGVPSLLEALRSRYRLACFTNTNATHWADLREQLAPHLDAAFASCDLGLAKPDRAAFEAVLSALQVGPHQVLFFDDIPENVIGASRSGLRAELVRGPSELRARLVQLGLLAGGEAGSSGTA